MAQIQGVSELENGANNVSDLTDVESICTLSDVMSNYELAAELKSAMSISNMHELNHCKERFILFLKRSGGQPYFNRLWLESLYHLSHAAYDVTYRMPLKPSG